VWLEERTGVPRRTVSRSSPWGDIKATARLGESGQGKDRNVVIPSLDPANIAPINLGQQGKFFLRNIILNSNATDRCTERNEHGILAIFGEIWHIVIVTL